MKVEVKETQSQEVDWTKNPQLVTREGNVIMTSLDQSDCTNEEFAGQVIVAVGNFYVGDYSTCFTKNLWKPFHGEITLKND